MADVEFSFTKPIVIKPQIGPRRGEQKKILKGRLCVESGEKMNYRTLLLRGDANKKNRLVQ